ncbi:MAG: PAM68 family protein [Prochlorotrichaceae cyanobacterium]
MAESEPKRLPFEPKKRKKKQAAAPTGAGTGPSSPQPPSVAKVPPSKPKPSPVTSGKSRATLEQTRIPDSVSRRMISRILVFSGIPTVLGISTFFASYLIVTREIFDLPNAAVLFVSLGCFGLGVLGLSYGVLSASWEEDLPGTLLGWQEFRVNLSRFLDAWRDFRQNKPSNG